MERFLDYFIPGRYDLDFLIDRHKRQFSGLAKVRGKVLSETVKLHAVGMDVHEVAVGGGVVDFEFADGVLLIRAEEWLGKEVEIVVLYQFKMNKDMQGVYISDYDYDGREETMVVTQLESHYARECFPCVDEPAAKAEFGLTITVVDEGDTVVANMPVVSEDVVEAGKRVVFQDTPRMSTYLLAFMVGRFVKLERMTKSGVKVTTYAGLHQPVATLEYAADFAVKCLDFYDDLFHTPFPLPKLDQVAVPDFEAGAMENWGLMTFREQALLVDKGSARDQKLYVATVVAHEISHMWFGDLVTMEWWDDLWLNEAFASLMETYATDKLAPELGAWDDFYMGTVVPALKRDCLPGVQPVRVDVANVEDIANLFDGAIVYAKGARLMLMLMRLMGEDNFFNGLKKYFAKHKYGNTVADDLWNSLTPYADFDVREFMTPWLTQPGYPVLRGHEQKRFLLTGEGESYKYPIPEVKDDLSGHYLIDLGTEKFAEAISNFAQKSKEQKLRLLLDRELLAKTPLVESASLLPLMAKFRDDVSYVVWDVVSLLVADLKIFMETGSEADKKYKRFVGMLVRNLYERLGVEAQVGEADEDIKLRPVALGLMYYAEDADFVAKVRRVYANQKPAEIDANVRAVVLSTLMRDDEGLAKEYLGLYLKTADPELKSDLMVALTATRNTEIVAGFLPLLKNGTIKAQDRLYFFARLARNAVARTQTLAWMYENWNWLEAVEGDKTIGEYPRLVAGLIRTEAGAKKYRKFFGARKNEPILARNVRVGLTEIEARLQLIAADAAAVKAELQKTID